MKTCLLILIVCLSVISTSAQLSERRGYIGISAGPAYPVGDFGSKSLSSENAQFAQRGYSTSWVNFGYLFKRHFGITAAIFYGENDVDRSGTEDWWQIMAITGGPMLSMPVFEKIRIDSKFRIGYIGTTRVIDSMSGQNDFGGGFGIDFRLTVRYDVIKWLCLFMEGGYISSRQKFPDSTAASIQEIIAGFGVAYRLK
jgi:hypothetical protein